MTRPAAKKPSSLLTQTEAAQYIGCARVTVQRALERGDLKPAKGGKLLQADLDAWKELRAREAKEQAADADLERRKLAAETAEREAKAALRALELERQRGDFVRLSDVRRDGADCGERVVSTLRAIPQRTALAIEAALAGPSQMRAAAVERLVSAEVERAIGAMKESAYVTAPGPMEFGAAGVCAVLAALAWMWPRKEKARG